jgi:hypothetical protein
MTTALRGDFDADGLRGLARSSKDAGPARRVLALAAIHKGATRTEAARMGSVTLWIVHDWVISISKQTLSRGLRAMDYRKLSGRARHHAQAERAIALFNKASLESWSRSPTTRALMRAI